MKQYTKPELSCIRFSCEEVITASSRTAEDKLTEQMMGEGFGLNKNDIVTVVW